MTRAPIAKPPLKWAGGKRLLLPELLKRVPTSFGNYHEPFFGGGALYWALKQDPRFRFRYAFVSDTNPRLVTAYRAIRNDPADVIKKLRLLDNKLATFLRVRGADVDSRNDAGVAAWLIYLNKTCFNGLYRVNREGKFNVPHGRYKNPVICDAENIRACSRILRDRTTIRACGFQSAAPDPGDFVYFDPPYYPVSATSNFTGYHVDGFTDLDHRTLRDVARKLKAQGVHVLLSHSSAGPIRELYGEGDFVVEEVRGSRSIHADASKRGAVTDLLIR